MLEVLLHSLATVLVCLFLTLRFQSVEVLQVKGFSEGKIINDLLSKSRGKSWIGCGDTEIMAKQDLGGEVDTQPTPIRGKKTAMMMTSYYKTRSDHISNSALEFP